MHLRYQPFVYKRFVYMPRKLQLLVEPQLLEVLAQDAALPKLSPSSTSGKAALHLRVQSTVLVGISSV